MGMVAHLSHCNSPLGGLLQRPLGRQSAPFFVARLPIGADLDELAARGLAWASVAWREAGKPWTVGREAARQCRMAEAIN